MRSIILLSYLLWSCGAVIGTSTRDLTTIKLRPDANLTRRACPEDSRREADNTVRVLLDGGSLQDAPRPPLYSGGQQASTACKLAGHLELQDEQGQSLHRWSAAQQCGSQSGHQWVEISLPQQPTCEQCRLVYRPDRATVHSSWSSCLSSMTPDKQAGWIYRVAGHLADAGASTKRRLLQQVQANTCVGSNTIVTGYEGCVYVTGNYPEPPPQKHWVHWTVDPANGGSVSFAVEVAPVGGGNSWAGLGWSPEGNPAHPPQMINGTAVMGWVDLDGNPQVRVYDLWAKNVEYIRPSYDQFTVTETSIEYTEQSHLVMRFTRKFDSVFNPDIPQRMITAHGHRIRAISQHGHRAALFMDASGQGSMRMTTTRLNIRKSQAHAWTMFAAFGVILPLGVIWARYFRDVWGKWYLLHLGVQAFGLLLAIAGFLIAVTQNNPIPRSLAHFQLGLAVIILAVLQPLNSIPRLTMHHAHVMRSVYWAYIHWLFGRATIAFAWVNMFLGIGRYRTWFNLGSWPEGALGLYFGSIILVCSILESKLWKRSDLRVREENDELSRRIAELEDSNAYHAHASPDKGKPLRHEDEDDGLLDQMTLRHNTAASDGDVMLESVNDDDLDQGRPRVDSQERLMKGSKGN